MKEALERLIGDIPPLDEGAMEAARARLDRLTKPPGSLGRLERLAERLAGMTGGVPPRLGRKAVVVMAADHGVTEEGVSAYPREVTRQMVLNFLAGGAAVNVFAKHAGADVVCVDMGIAEAVGHPGLIVRRIGPGTANMARGPAMTEEEAVRALAAGIEMAGQLAEEGYGLLAVGEMGIGNTTAASALTCALLGVPAAEAVGRGTGVDDEGLARKRSVVERALAVNGLPSDPGSAASAVVDGGGAAAAVGRVGGDVAFGGFGSGSGFGSCSCDAAAVSPSAALAALSRVGGFELAGIAGVCIGAAKRRMPVIIDGFISTAAALAAVRLAPLAVGYLIASHRSAEPGHTLLLEALGLAPMLELGMRLGEGTGAALCMRIVEAAADVLGAMATFESAGIFGPESQGISV